MISACNSPASICLGSLAIRPFRVHRGTVAGRAETLPTATMTTEERFWAKVDKNGPIQPHCPELGRCWQWTGGHGKIWQYGAFYSEDKALVRAHRWAYKSFVGPIPVGKWVLHKCDNPSCVNPDHLWLGNHSDNMRDASAKGRLKVPHPNGENASSAKLTSSQVIEIRSDKNKALSCYRIAQNYGVSYRTIHYIKTGRTWKHLLETTEDLA